MIAAEDQRFFEHPGYELDAWCRCSRPTSARASRCGASTITQQLAKLLYTGDERGAAQAARSGCTRWRWSARSAKTTSCSSASRCCPGAMASAALQAAAPPPPGKSAHQLKPREAAWLGQPG